MQFFPKKIQAIGKSNSWAASCGNGKRTMKGLGVPNYVYNIYQKQRRISSILRNHLDINQAMKTFVLNIGIRAWFREGSSDQVIPPQLFKVSLFVYLFSLVVWSSERVFLNIVFGPIRAYFYHLMISGELVSSLDKNAMGYPNEVDKETKFAKSNLSTACPN